jgi:hypothetical protein
MPIPRIFSQSSLPHSPSPSINSYSHLNTPVTIPPPITQIPKQRPTLWILDLRWNFSYSRAGGNILPDWRYGQYRRSVCPANRAALLYGPVGGVSTFVRYNTHIVNGVLYFQVLYLILNLIFDLLLSPFSSYPFSIIPY